MSERLEDWDLAAAMNRGGAVVAAYQRVGKDKALTRLEEFASGPMAAYTADRDLPGLTRATSGLSENLAWGEIGPRAIWHRGWRAMAEGKMLQIIAFAMTSPLQTPKQKHKNDSHKGVNKPVKPPASISNGTNTVSRLPI